MTTNGRREPLSAAVTPSDATLSTERDPNAMPPWLRRAMIWFFVGVVAIMLGSTVITRLRHFFVLLLVSIFLSFAMEPGVNRLSGRGMRRGSATAVVFVLLIVFLGLFVVLIGQVLATQMIELADQLPAIIANTEQWLQRNVDSAITLDAVSARALQSGGISDQMTNLAGGVVGYGTMFVTLLFDLFTVFLFTFYLVAEGPRFRRLVCSFLPPGRQARVLHVWDLGVEKTGGYIASRAVLALVSSLVHYAAFLAIGLPSPLPLALWMGLVSQFIPVVGLYIAAAVPVIIALIDSPISGLWVIVVVAIYQQFENYVLTPRVTAQTMQIHPAVAFGSVLVGSALLGPIGALLALPVSATVQGFLSTVVRRHEVDELALAHSARLRGEYNSDSSDDATSTNANGVELFTGGEQEEPTSGSVGPKSTESQGS